MEGSSGKTGCATSKVTEVRPSEKSFHINTEHAERMDGAFWSIICSATIPCGLILTIAGVLVAVIMRTQISRDEGYHELRIVAASATHTHSASVSTTLGNVKRTGGDPAFFIHFNPSSLTAIATLTGKLIPYLSSSIMALVAFFAARRIIVSSRDAQNNELLSPHQLSILIELLGGSSITPLKDCVRYHIKSKKKWTSPLPQAFIALAAVTTLGILIPLVDTWFSTTVTPTTVATVRKSNYTSQFGRAFDCPNLLSLAGNACTNSPTPCNLGCMTGDGHVQYVLDGFQQATETINSASSTNVVWNFTNSTTGEYYTYIADFAVSSNPDVRDFEASTIAVQTQCEIMTGACLTQQPGNEFYIDNQYDFSCPSGFHGNLLSNGATLAANFNTTTVQGHSMTGIAFSPDTTLSTIMGESEFASFQNPLHFGAWSVGWQQAPPTDSGFDNGFWDNSGDLYYDSYWNYVWMLNCTSTIYDVTYSFVNGSIIKWIPSLAPQAAGGLLSVPYVSGLSLGSLTLDLATTAVNKAQNPSQLTSLWSNAFSYYSMAILAGSLRPANNYIEQVRDNRKSATRVPMIPLFLLLGLKLLYCLAVLALAIAAWHYTNPRETQSVKERLTVKGLAAAYFAEGASHQKIGVKNVEQLFQDSSRGDTEPARGVTDDKVGMKPTELGGWEFVKLAASTAWTQVEPIVAGEIIAQASAGDFGVEGKEAAGWVGLVR